MIFKIVALLLIVNVIGTIVLWKRDKSLLYVIYSFSILFFFGVSTYSDLNPEWKQYQYQYRDLLTQKETDPEKKAMISDFPIKIRQVWNKELGVTDRCTTCHLGVDNPDMADAPAPFTFHKAAHIQDDGVIVHDFEDIGCTICHQGQGLGTDKYRAHGIDLAHWELPIYPVGKTSMVEASCSQCHEALAAVEQWEPLDGAEMISDARTFADGDNDFSIQCRDCHSIYGLGEILAPDLGSFGESTEHEFEATHIMDFVEGKKNKYNWTYQHFLDPQKITPDNKELGLEETIMPNFEMSEELARKFVVWVYSMKESKVPVKFRYRPKPKKKKSVAEQIAGLYTPEEFAGLPKGEKLFIRRNCWICHTIHGKGGKLAPDLSKVGKRRSEEWMIRHFKDPRSVSQKSFMPQFNLTDTQIMELVDYLKTLE